MSTEPTMEVPTFTVETDICLGDVSGVADTVRSDRIDFFYSCGLCVRKHTALQVKLF